MFLRPQKRVQEDEEPSQQAKQNLVQDVFGGEEDVNVVLPPPQKIIALMWIYREDDSVVKYLCELVEKHVMKQPKLVDSIEIYLPQLIQLALQWDPVLAENGSTNSMERLLLILAQLSTRFAVQYHWSLQNIMEDLQLECAQSGQRRNSKFDMDYYARCMLLVGDLERCMSGKRRRTNEPLVPKLEITASYGGKVTNDEVHSIIDEETNQGFFDAIVTVAEDNAASSLTKGEKGSVASLDVPLKKTFGGVLLFKRMYRNGARRKIWKERYFAIEESLLNCYSRDRKLLRSMSLEGATIWKGLQPEKYPHSFVVANNNTMFHLRATSEEQKSAWKYKLRAAITASTLPDDLPDSQKERYKKYQNAKWFGRTLTEITNDLDSARPRERHEVLHDVLFELDMPEGMNWPWLERDCFSEKPVYAALPHFSHLVSKETKKRGFPSPFQASFMVKRDETADSNAYERFLQEGRQNNLSEPLVAPDGILSALKSRVRPSRTLDDVDKGLDSGSTTGASTEGLSIGESSATEVSAEVSIISGYESEASSSDSDDKSSESDESEETASDKGASFQINIPWKVPIGRHISDLTQDVAYDTVGNAKSKEGVKSNDRACGTPLTIKEEEDSIQNRRNRSVELVLKGNAPTGRTTEDVESTVSTITEDDTVNEDATSTEEDSIQKRRNPSVELVLKGTPLPVKNTEDNKEDDSESGLECPCVASNEVEHNHDDRAQVNEKEDLTTAEWPKGNEVESQYDEVESIAMTTTARRSFFHSESSMSLGVPAENKGLVSLRTKPYQQEELLAAQLGQHYESDFSKSMVWIRAPRVRRISRDMMITEVPKEFGVTSIAEAKRSLEDIESACLLDYFVATYGPQESQAFQRAQSCFAQSLAGLFLLSYLLGIKNQDTESFMIDQEGHIFVYDYGQVFNGDGSGLGSFKLTKEYMSVLGGPSSPCFKFFRSMLLSALKRAREDADTTLGLLRLVPGSAEGCKQRDHVVRYLRQKLILDESEEAVDKRMRSAIRRSFVSAPFFSKSWRSSSVRATSQAAF